MRAVDYLTHCGEAVASREFSIGEADENAVAIGSVSAANVRYPNGALKRMPAAAV